MKRFKSIIAPAFLAGLVLFWATLPAKASLVLTIEVLDASNTVLGTATATMDTNTQTISSSSGPGFFLVDPTSAAGANQLDYAGIFGGVAFSLAVAAGSNSPGSATMADLSIGYNTITNSASGDRKIVIFASDSGFTAPLSPPLLSFATSTSGTVTGSAKDGSFNANASGIAANAINFGPVTGVNQSIGVNGIPSVVSIVSSPYTIDATYGVTLTNLTSLKTGGGLVTLSAVPEPATLAMAFSGLPIIGLLAWRMRRKARA